MEATVGGQSTSSPGGKWRRGLGAACRGGSPGPISMSSPGSSRLPWVSSTAALGQLCLPAQRTWRRVRSPTPCSRSLRSRLTFTTVVPSCCAPRAAGQDPRFGGERRFYSVQNTPHMQTAPPPHLASPHKLSKAQTQNTRTHPAPCTSLSQRTRISKNNR